MDAARTSVNPEEAFGERGVTSLIKRHQSPIASILIVQRERATPSGFSPAQFVHASLLALVSMTRRAVGPIVLAIV